MSFKSSCRNIKFLTFLFVLTSISFSSAVSSDLEDTQLEAEHSFNTSLRYLGTRIGYQESPVQQAFKALSRVYSSKKDDLQTALLVAQNPSYSVESDERIDLEDRISYKEISDFVHEHYVPCASERTLPLHIKNKLAVVLGRESSFYKRRDYFGFHSLFNEEIRRIKKERSLDGELCQAVKSENIQKVQELLDNAVPADGFGINTLPPISHSEGLNTTEGIRSFLSQKTAVSNRGGSTYDCSDENPDEVLSSVNLSLQLGVSTFLEGEILEHNPEAEAIPFARSFASLLREGKPLEKITAKEVGVKDPKDLNYLKNALNLTINHFCWENGVTTEVTQQEVTSLLVLRHRLINYKKNLSM